MKFAANQCLITPPRPVRMAGYGLRDHESEGVHDELKASIFVLEIHNEEYVWVGCDLIQGIMPLIDAVLEKLEKKGKRLEKDHFILGGSHTHSGPNISVDRDPVNSDPECLEMIAGMIAEGIAEALDMPRMEVETRYSDVVIDGLYSNRSKADGICDKHVHLLGFLAGEKLEGLFVCLSHHCTILGPKNYLLSADLFGAMRNILEETYQTNVLMAQGNAGDVSNRMFRKNADFEEVQTQAERICEQIQQKLFWKPVHMESVSRERYVHTAEFYIDAPKYEKDIQYYEERLKNETNMEAVKLMQSELYTAKRRVALGDGEHTVNMPVEIWDIGDVQILVIPAELGSSLGLDLKRNSYKPVCLVWGYTNGANLSYLVDSGAYRDRTFESQMALYPEGVADSYVEFIKEKMKERNV